MNTIHILIQNDPSVGLADENYFIHHMEFVDAEHRAMSVEVLRRAFAVIGGTASEDVQVNVIPE